MNFLRYLIGMALLVCVAHASAKNVEERSLPESAQHAAQTAGIGSLKDSDLPEHSSEIRIWIGFGVAIPNHMLRFRVDSKGVVSGEVLVHFPSDLSYMPPADIAEFRRDVMRNCTNLRKGKESDVCTATFKRPPNWKFVLKKLVSLGIRTLPDDSQLPKPEMDFTDGIAMAAEVRDGSSYRIYWYSNPQFRSEPEAIAATKIMDIVIAVFHQSNDS